MRGLRLRALHVLDEVRLRDGWPSFTGPAHADAVEHVREVGLLGVRTEVRCRACASHLGHVFPDGPTPAGLRYCMNSLALELVADPDSAATGG
jgi:peptide-methionine (R)-S-oxide reductase